MALQMMILAYLSLMILAAEAFVQRYETVGKFIMYTKVVRGILEQYLYIL